MKLLFLDIDGVVNCETTSQRHRGFIGIDPYMAFMVGKIQLDTNCQVVLSSSWRATKDGIDEVEKQVCKLLSVTPHSPNGFRGDEILMWFDKWNEHVYPNPPDELGRQFESIEKYAILDDNTDFYDYQPLFKTEWKTGITEEIAKKVTDHLNEK